MRLRRSMPGPLCSMLTRRRLKALPHDQESAGSLARLIVPGMAAILSATLLAFVIRYIHSVLPQNPERAVQWIGMLFVGVVASGVGVYIVLQRRLLDPRALGLILLTTLSTLLVSAYLYWVSFYVFFPADSLLWS